MHILVFIFLFISNIVFGQNNSLLYQIKEKDKKTSYLFGTIHMIPDSLYYFPAKLDKIIAKSDEIVLEVANLSANQSAVMKLLILDSGSCFDIFTPQQKDSVLNWGAQLLNVKPEQFEKSFEKRKPFTLMQLSFQKMISGKVRLVDMEIESKAQHDNIPVSGLETVEFQLSVFDKIPAPDMAEMIMDVVRNPGESEKNFREMVLSYSNQDLEGLARLIQKNDELGNSADELLDKRNHNWIPKMEELMKSKACLFAVGAGHLGGPNGIIELLRKKGYEITPVRY